MEYPHKRYLAFLVTRKLNAYEIMSDCSARGLVPPTETAVELLVRAIGRFPRQWSAEALQGNVPFRRWLRDQDVHDLWVRNQDAVDAFDILHQSIRNDVEAMLLIHSDLAQVRQELLLKHSAGVVPSAAVLKKYREFFWDFSGMGSQAKMEFLVVYQEIRSREDLVPAAQQDLSRAYGMLGIQQRVKDEALVQELVDFAFQQVSLARRAATLHNGAQLAGIATVGKAAMDAIRFREETRVVATEEVSLREEAQVFQLRLLEQKDEIPSIDEIQVEYEAPEEEEDDDGRIIRLHR